MSEVIIEVDDELLQRALKKAPKELQLNMAMAGAEALSEVLDTEGIRQYPPETAANHPPTPYYVRGQGTQYASYNKGNSEQYGKRWGIQHGYYTSTAESFASYAPYLGGEEQASHMASKGWRKIVDVANEKIDKLRRIYDLWVTRALRKAGL